MFLPVAVRIAFVDDNDDRGDLCCDAVLNANAHAEDLPYEWFPLEKRASGLMLGPRFALLRPEFLAERGDQTPEASTFS